MVNSVSKNPSNFCDRLPSRAADRTLHRPWRTWNMERQCPTAAAYHHRTHRARAACRPGIQRTQRRHATCSPATRLHTVTRSARFLGVPPKRVSSASAHPAPNAWRDARAGSNRTRPSLALALLDKHFQNTGVVSSVPSAKPRTRLAGSNDPEVSIRLWD